MLTFGESLLTSKPAPSKTDALLADGCTAQLQAVGGAEMNTAVALARTGCSAGWVSVLPHGPLGDLVTRVARDAGVDVFRLAPQGRTAKERIANLEYQVDLIRSETG